MQNDGPGKIIVAIHPDLSDLAAGYIANRRHDVATLKGAVHRGDFETIRDIGHSMKGSGGGYGFDRLTELGGALEQAAKGREAGILVNLTEALEKYLAGIAIVTADCFDRVRPCQENTSTERLHGQPDGSGD